MINFTRLVTLSLPGQLIFDKWRHSLSPMSDVLAVQHGIDLQCPEALVFGYPQTMTGLFLFQSSPKTERHGGRRLLDQVL